MNDRLSCLTAETIIKIVSGFYSSKEIVEAKTVLHNNYEGQSKNNEPKSLLAIFVAIKSKVIHQKKAQG